MIYRSSSPKILSYSEPAELQNYAGSTADSVATRSGAVVTYGPFQDLPATTGLPFQDGDQQLLTLHCEYDSPIVTVVSLDHSAEISH
jgi:oligosaccharyltransferase complex subunit alpha (ribophorin I)